MSPNLPVSNEPTTNLPATLSAPSAAMQGASAVQAVPPMNDVPATEAIEPIQLPLAQVMPETEIQAPQAMMPQAQIAPSTQPGLNQSATVPVVPQQNMVPPAQYQMNVTQGQTAPSQPIQQNSYTAQTEVPLPPKGMLETFGPQIMGVGAILIGFACVGWLVVRLKSRGGIYFQKPEKHMEIVSTLTLGPKRQILLVRIRDQELALMATEQGISVLTETKPAASRLNALEELLRARQQSAAAPKPSRTTLSDPTPALQQIAQNSEDKLRTQKQELLKRALETLKSKSPATRAEATVTSNAMPPKKGKQAFPKYLANAFEKNSGNVAEDEDGSSADQVTNMIREKLKTLEQPN